MQTDLSNIGELKSCSFCGSVEGQPRMVGGYIVQLTSIQFEEEDKLACQGCKVKYRTIQLVREKERQQRAVKKSWFKRLFSNSQHQQFT